MNVFELFGTIAINNEDANKAITDTSGRANRLASTMQTSFGKIGTIATQCGKVIASGMAVGAAAMGSIIKSAIDEYAEYEQLVGGVETLFKDSSDKVMQYAKQAYRNQGLSANGYMSTVTSFSAALLQGLNGDTAAAAAMADIAITDMADNANKMGTSMSSIQDAYQGFAKQNYTMLDNLKLGYGGTQSEMARLINDSGVLGDAMTVTAETVNDVSFDVIIAAIHEIQTEMGITGTTAKEAAETISGSFSAFKSSWTNLLTGLANDEDMQPLADAFLDTGKTFAENVSARLPVIKENFIETFTYIAENSGEILSTLGTALDSLFDIDTTTLWWLELLAGTAAMLSGHYAVGLGLFAAAGFTEDKMWDEQAAQYDLASGLMDGDPEAIEAYKNSVSTDDGTEQRYFTPDEWEEELRQRYEDSGRMMNEGSSSSEEDYAPNDTSSSSSSGPSIEEIIEGLKNGTIQDPMGGMGIPSSNNELQTTIQNWTNTFDVNTMGDTIAAKVSEAITAAMGGMTITTGNVTLNDGALVGRILPRINLGLGMMAARDMRG